MHEERARVDRRLRDKAVRGGYTQEAREECREAEKSEIVMKPSRLAERKLGSLRDQRLRQAQAGKTPVPLLQTWG
jgi:hypothetical protein